MKKYNINYAVRLQRLAAAVAGDVNVALIVETKRGYYSFDGDPVKDGKQYISPLSLDEEKEYTVKAVAVDKRGIYSEVVTA